MCLRNLFRYSFTKQILPASHISIQNIKSPATNSAEVNFKDLISDELKQAIIQANPAIDPFEIIGQRAFSKESYDHALILADTLQEVNFRQVDDKMRAYEYI